MAGQRFEDQVFPMKTALCLMAAAAALVSAGRAAASYEVTRVMHVGGSGAWDYIAFDPETHLLFVPRTTHTQVVEAQSGKVVADIPGQKRNHGVAIVHSAGRGFITDGGNGCVYVFDLKSYQVLGSVKLEDDADGIQYDPGTNKVLVVCGDPGHLYAFAPDIDPNGGSPGTPADLGGSIEYLAADGKGKAFVNINDKNQVGVVDLATMKVTDKWTVGDGGKPVGMSIDREHGRIFVGCRGPQKLVVLSTDGGKVLGQVDIGAGVDATVFDDGLAFASCRDGTLTVAAQSGDSWAAQQVVKTRAGARTMCVDPQTHEIFLPTAEMGAGKKARPKAGSFMIVVVGHGL
jgi:DNA-binding beta-propeller fold protein YncE